MRLAVTGGAGGLGKAFVSRAAGRHEVVPFTRAELPVEEQGAVQEAMKQARPDIVLNFAAMTSVDGCETDPEGAFRANALGARNVAIAARSARAVVVHVSTDYVFDGEKGSPYHEFDDPAPVSVYGRSKLAGEREVSSLAPDHLIVRTSWVFGGGKDFLTGALTRLNAGERVPAIADLVGSPTFVGHLAEALLSVLDSGLRGVLHLAGPEPSSWHDLLERTVSRLGLQGEVAAQKSDELGRPAPRPANSSLESLVRGPAGLREMPPLDDAIDEVMRGLRGG